MNWNQSPLQQLLAPLTPEEFQREVFGQTFRHIPNQNGKDFRELFDWEALNNLLNNSGGTFLNLRIVKDSLNYLFQKQADNLQDILQSLRGGGTLVLEGIDRRNEQLAKLCDALSAEIGAETRINLYLSYPGQSGYPLHYDTHDFLILQVYGHKYWEIFPATIPDPLLPARSFSSPYHKIHSEADQMPPPAESRLGEVQMAPGDLLYVPKGYWHRALAQREPSLHLTVGLYLPTGLDLLNWLQAQLQQRPSFRRAFPWCPKSAFPRQSQDPSPYREQAAKLKAEVLGLLNDPSLLARFHQDNWAKLEHRQSFALPHQYLQTPAELADCSYFQVRQVPHYLLDFPDGHLELVYQHQKLNFAASARPLLEFVLQRTQFSRQELEAAFPSLNWLRLREVLLPLVQDGLLLPQS